MNALVRNNVTITGEGSPTLLFAHGFGCDQSMWRHVTPAFARRATVALFDHVGAGASDLDAYDPEKYDSLRGYAQDVVEICEALGRGPVVFVGHSVSATIGVIAAADRPDLFSGLVLICPSPRYANAPDYNGGFEEADLYELLDLLDKNQLEWSGALSPVVMGSGHEAQEGEWRESVCRMAPSVAKQFARVTFLSDNREDFHRVRTPTLLVECSEDALAPAQVGAWVRDAISGSERVVLDVSGHCPHMSDPDTVVAALDGFVFDARRKAA